MKRTAMLSVLAAVLVILPLVRLAHAAAPPPEPRIPAASPAELQQLLASKRWVIVEFGGERCIPCMHMQPVLTEVQQALGKKAVVRNFWIQEHPEVAEVHKIMVMPTQLVFNPKGEEVFRHMGYFPLDQFKQALKEKGLL